MPHYQINNLACMLLGFPGGLGVKNPLASAGFTGSVPGLGRSPREGNGYPRQYSCLRNPTDRGASRATMLYFTVTRISIKVSFVLVRLRGGTWGNSCYFSLMEIESASNPAVMWQQLIWFFGSLGSSCGHMIFLQKEPAAFLPIWKCLSILSFLSTMFLTQR